MQQQQQQREPKKQRHHDLPRSLASSGFSKKGLYDCPTLRNGAQSPHYGDAIFCIKLPASVFYLHLFYRPLTGALASKK